MDGYKVRGHELVTLGAPPILINSIITELIFQNMPDFTKLVQLTEPKRVGGDS